jgi:hypothetical protein
MVVVEMEIDEETGMSLEHKQAPITYEGEVIFTVDEKLKSLIQFFVDKGIETFNSCEDNTNGNAWIAFELEDWMFINEIAFSNESRDLNDFIEEQCEVLLLSGDDGEPGENEEYWIEGENLIWSASVRFPKELLEDFEQLIRFNLEHVNMGVPGSIH